MTDKIKDGCTDCQRVDPDEPICAECEAFPVDPEYSEIEMCTDCGDEFQRDANWWSETLGAAFSAREKQS